jgi:LmbE family N-acetylglucosaminyl deacetylase
MRFSCTVNNIQYFYFNQMKKIPLFLLSIVLGIEAIYGQKNSAEIYTQLKQMEVLGSVLYIAAHPDDENNAFLPYLTKERYYRTAYLSLTRGDGGQNLIGKEQGVELGLIRTQELLAARMQDGAEQYFSTAYEFGFSKSAKEALTIWDHQKVLSDVVWVIRKFQPDVIITRFPGDARAGHGHHAASSIIAQEAFVAAADPKQFPEQFKYGVQPWKAKRILWNTFNFGTVNTTNDNQLKLEVGGYNPIIGKSYGEIGAEARTMHKSQGEGRPRRRGSYFEFFQHLNGDSAKLDIMEGVNTSWARLQATSIQASIKNIISSYNINDPAASVPSLVKLYQQINTLPSSNWKNYKLDQVQEIIKSSAGIYIEATINQQQVIPGEKVKVQFLFNQRSNTNSILQAVRLPFIDTLFNKSLLNNRNIEFSYILKVPDNKDITQPYWLKKPKKEGMFVVDDQVLIGKSENDPEFDGVVNVEIEKQLFSFKIPLQYKYLDPTKGDVYQPIAVVPDIELKYSKDVYLAKPGAPIILTSQTKDHKGNIETKDVIHKASELPTEIFSIHSKSIEYDHIPTITYFPNESPKIVVLDVKNTSKHIGYIDGAGDKLPEALVELGAQITYLKEEDITIEKLKSYDAIVVGIRAFNMYAYLSDKQAIFNDYIASGGNLIVQYIKSNQVGTHNIKMGPYPFTINSGKRVTEENAAVRFLLPNHPVLNIPNKINAEDFNNWVQERSTYQAENIDTHFQTPLQMNDTGETPSQGSLLIAPFGKGNFAYVSLALFRQLPAGNPGAYKLLANLISLPKN